MIRMVAYRIGCKLISWSNGQPNRILTEDAMRAEEMIENPSMENKLRIRRAVACRRFLTTPDPFHDR